MSVGGSCDAAVTAGMRKVSTMVRECGELLHGKRFPTELKGAVYKSYVRSEIPHEIEAWRLRKARWEYSRHRDQF